MLRRVMLAAFMGQTFEPHDLLIVLLLVVLEGTLSVDNALVLGLLAKKLPKEQRSKALSYGLVGAFVFRLIALAAAAFLLKWAVFKLIGGAYLLYVALKHFVLDREKPAGADGEKFAVARVVEGKFWPTVVAIELTDIAFAVDSIVAAIGVVGNKHNVDANTDTPAAHPKLWVVLIGGFLGVVLMRFAAAMFVRLLEKFPRFETAAYLLVTLIALKLIVDYAGHVAGWQWVDFHSPRRVTFWAFWLAMVACFAVGFLNKPAPAKPV